MLQEMKPNGLREKLRDAPHFPTGITLKCVICDNVLVLLRNLNQWFQLRLRIHYRFR